MRKRAILIIGDREPDPAELEQAAGYAEVFVLARTVPDPHSRYLIDDELAHRRATDRLRSAVARLRSRGAHVSGIVGDADPRAARRDAFALFPRASALLEAA